MGVGGLCLAPLDAHSDSSIFRDLLEEETKNGKCRMDIGIRGKRDNFKKAIGRPATILPFPSAKAQGADLVDGPIPPPVTRALQTVCPAALPPSPAAAPAPAPSCPSGGRRCVPVSSRRGPGRPRLEEQVDPRAAATRSAVKGGSGTRAATPTCLRGNRGGRRGRPRGLGGADGALGRLSPRSVTPADLHVAPQPALPQLLTPPDPSPAQEPGVRAGIASGTGCYPPGEGRQMGPPPQSYFWGKPQFENRSNDSSPPACMTMGWGAACAGLRWEPMLPLQKRLDEIHAHQRA